MFIFYLLTSIRSETNQTNQTAQTNKTISPFSEGDCDPESDLYYFCLIYKEVEAGQSNTSVVLESIILAIMVVISIAYTVNKKFCSYTSDILEGIQKLTNIKEAITQREPDEINNSELTNGYVIRA